MAETVRGIDVGVDWDAITEDAMLVSGTTSTWLILDPYIDDPDQRDVVLKWHHAWYSLESGPNDEARHNHRLYAKGLNRVQRVGVVEESELIADLWWRKHKEGRNGRSRFTDDHWTHYVVVTKGQVIEVIAHSLEVQRVDALRSMLFAVVP